MLGGKHRLAALLAALVTAGCGFGGALPVRAQQTTAQGKPVRDVVLASTTLPGHGGQILELVDARGHFLHNRVVGPFQGDNWTGSFQLRVISAGGQTISALTLPRQEFTLFMRRFRFSFADYSGDGSTEFALGQYRSSNVSGYVIFALEPHGLRRLPVSGGEVLAEPNLGYSPAFPLAGRGAFTSTYYDNAATTWYKVTYRWTGRKFSQSRAAYTP